MGDDMKKEWEVKKLGEVVDIINGRNQSKVISEDGIFPIIGSAGKVMGYATEYICEEGTTIIGRKGNISNPIYINEPFWNVDTAFGIYPKHNYDTKFIHYLCLNIDFKSRNRGTTIPSLVKSDLVKIEIPFIPHITEQLRIVSILDKAFEAIDKAKQNAEQNLNNAKELFESYLQGVFEERGEGWEETTLGEIGTPRMCKRIFKNETSIDGDIPFYKIGTFGKKADAYITKELFEEYKRNYSYPNIGDVLISASGTIGRRVAFDGEPAYFQDSNIVWIDNDETKVLNTFLYCFYGYCKWETTSGATIKRLYNSNLKQIKISYPISQKLQQSVVQETDNFYSHTQSLESIYQQKLDDLEELKKSILEKAFSGEL